MKQATKKLILRIFCSFLLLVSIAELYKSYGGIILVVTGIPLFLLISRYAYGIFKQKRRKENTEKEDRESQVTKITSALSLLKKSYGELFEQNRTMNTSLLNMKRDSIEMKKEYENNLQLAIDENKRDLLKSFYQTTEDTAYNQSDIFYKQQAFKQHESKNEEIERKQFVVEMKEEFLEQNTKISEIQIAQEVRHNETYKMHIDSTHSLERAQILYEKQQNEIESAKKEFKLEKDRLQHYEEVIDSKFQMAKMQMETFFRGADITMKEMELKQMTTNLLRESTQVDIDLEHQRLVQLEQSTKHFKQMIQQELKQGRAVDALESKLENAHQDLHHSRMRVDSLMDEMTMIKRYGQ